MDEMDNRDELAAHLRDAGEMVGDYGCPLGLDPRRWCDVELRRPDMWGDLLAKDDAGSVRVVTSYTDDSNYSYHPIRLPGNPQIGDRVEVAWGYFGNEKQCRCRVAGREYVAIADGPIWQALDTGEIINMWRSFEQREEPTR